MPVNIIDTLKPKNGLNFPVVEAIDVFVENYENLADAISHFATDAMIAAINAVLSGKANASDVNTAVANLQGQINQIVISASSEAVVAPEVAAARVGDDGTEYATLKARLDSDSEKATSEIERTNSDLSQIAAVIGTFPQKLAVGFMTEDGTFNDANAYRSLYSDVVIDSSRTYQYKGVGRALAYSCIYYDASGTIIDRAQIESTTYVNLTIPAGAVRARFASFANYTNPGDENNIIFGVKTTQNIESDIAGLTTSLSSTDTNLQNLSDKTELDVSGSLEMYLYPKNKNTFNPDFIARNGYVNAVTGNFVEASQYNASQFIPLKDFNTGIALSGAIRTVCYYDINKKFISGVSLSTPEEQAAYTETLANVESIHAKYMRFSYFKNTEPQVEDNTATTEYIKPDFTSNSVDTIASKSAFVQIVECFKDYFDVDDEAMLEAELTDTYGYCNTDGQIVNVGVTTYNYAPVSVQKGKFYVIHSALYKLVTPFVFVGSDGTVINSTDTNPTSDPSVIPYTLTLIPPVDGTVYINYYQEPIWIAQIDSYGDFSTLKESCLPEGFEKSGNILYGKKWAVCGDSFSNGDFTGSTDPYTIPDGKYQGYNAVYGYLIANRNNMTIQHLAANGKTLATPSDGTFTNTFTYTSGGASYQDVAADVDYITIYFGINDSHHRPDSTGSDGEDQTGVIELGTITDNTTATFYGAWNVALSWLIANRPFAHIGIIVSNGCETDDYRQATIAIANKYGLPYIDLNGDSRTPLMLRSTNPNISTEIKNARTAAMRVSAQNGHPSVAAHNYESTFIENFLRSI